MNHIYKNKYGRLEIEVIGQYQFVSAMKSREFDNRCFFEIDDAEKIALITGNKRIQISFAAWDLTKGYLVHHQSSNVAALCRIVRIDFDKNINGRKELNRPNPYRGPLLSGF